MKSWRSATSNLLSRISVWAAALWWGSLSIIGFLVVPMLFMHLPTPAMAGSMAAKLFSAQTWVSTLCGLLLLLSLRANMTLAPVRNAQVAIVFIVTGLLFAMLSEYAVAPRIVARENLRLWHTVGSAMYVLQWCCATAILWKLTSPRVSIP